MPRRSKKWIAEILTPTLSAPVDIAAKVHASSASIRNYNVDDTILERKIILATKGFTTHKFCELVLKDRNRLSKENALTICEYVIAMKREINPRLSYKRYTIQVLAELSKAVGIVDFVSLIFDTISCSFLHYFYRFHYIVCPKYLVLFDLGL
jgi:hypothetical protein